LSLRDAVDAICHSSGELIAQLDLHKARRYIHAMFRIVTRKLQQQYRFKGGICACAFRD
jgi:hypothetical protein